MVIKIKILIDNYPVFGLSIYVETERHKVLFDTGSDPIVLKRIIDKEKIDPEFIVISHEHFDHIGGIFALKKPVYLPKHSSSKIKNTLKAAGYKIIEVENTIFLDDIIIFGELYGPPYEISLGINDNGKLILLTGCSHPGILKIAEKSIKESKLEPYKVIGGFSFTRRYKNC